MVNDENSLKTIEILILNILYEAFQLASMEADFSTCPLKDDTCFII